MFFFFDLLVRATLKSALVSKTFVDEYVACRVTNKNVRTFTCFHGKAASVKRRSSKRKAISAFWKMLSILEGHVAIVEMMTFHRSKRFRGWKSTLRFYAPLCNFIFKMNGLHPTRRNPRT